MKKELSKLVEEALDQLFGVKPPKNGVLILTPWCIKRMHEYQITYKDLEDVFRYGEEVKPNMIVRKYRNYSIGLVYKIEETPWHMNIKSEQQFVITTCWKR